MYPLDLNRFAMLLHCKPFLPIKFPDRASLQQARRSLPESSLVLPCHIYILITQQVQSINQSLASSLLIPRPRTYAAPHSAWLLPAHPSEHPQRARISSLRCDPRRSRTLLARAHQPHTPAPSRPRRQSLPGSSSPPATSPSFLASRTVNQQEAF
jgi:hypothetical protein